MYVPTVDEYPAEKQLSIPEWSIPKLLPVWIMNYVMQTIVMNSASQRGGKSLRLEGADDTGYRLLLSVANGVQYPGR